MTDSSFVAHEGELLFHWEQPRHHKIVIAGFLLASVALHALCFYLFQVVYPPAISLLPPPAQVSVITPTTPEGHAFLNWLQAEDPALTSKTQPPAEAPAYQLPRLAHIPSYRAVPPRLKGAPPPVAIEFALSAAPPAPVPVARVEPSAPLSAAPTSVHFSESLADRPVTIPTVRFHSSERETPESARFWIAVDSLGLVRYCFLEQSSGDSTIDEQARQYLALCRFQSSHPPTTEASLTWGKAIFDFGTDLLLPATSMEHNP